ncbi:hypothetical protein ABIE33_007127 [Ensifer sp. 4252]
MPKKIAVSPESGAPKKQPVRRPVRQEATPEPDDCKHPCRDTRETPAPNPNGEPFDGS